MPGGYILVGQPRRDIEHDDGALAMNVIAISETTKLLLASCVPAVKAQLAPVGCEIQRVDFHTNGGCTREQQSQNDFGKQEGSANHA